MKPGDIIEKMININIKIWHERERSPKELADRLETGVLIRELNAERSKLRWEIDKNFEDTTNETKLSIVGVE